MSRLLIIVLLLMPFLAKAQDKTFTENQLKVYSDEDYLYRHEIVGGINFHSNGGLLGGFVGRYSFARTPSRYHAICLEVVELKSSREVKPIGQPNPIVYFKINRLYVVRPMYAQEFVLFRKAKDQGVQINWLLGIGPGIGLLSPYMIHYEGQTVPYDPKIHTLSKIEGAAPATQGWSRIKPKMGVSAKTALTFEFGAFKSSVSGFELGVVFDGFGEKMPIMDNGFSEIPNRQFFTSIYLSWYLGLRN